jgi:hypothetical protein
MLLYAKPELLDGALEAEERALDEAWSVVLAAMRVGGMPVGSRPPALSCETPKPDGGAAFRRTTANMRVSGSGRLARRFSGAWACSGNWRAPRGSKRSQRRSCEPLDLLPRKEDLDLEPTAGRDDPRLEWAARGGRRASQTTAGASPAFPRARRRSLCARSRKGAVPRKETDIPRA